MSVLKNCDAKVQLFAGRNKSQEKLSQTARAGEANAREIAPERPGASRPTFAEDFMLEHSHTSVRITSIEMTGSF